MDPTNAEYFAQVKENLLKINTQAVQATQTLLVMGHEMNQQGQPEADAYAQSMVVIISELNMTLKLLYDLIKLQASFYNSFQVQIDQFHGSTGSQ